MSLQWPPSLLVTQQDSRGLRLARQWGKEHTAELARIKLRISRTTPLTELVPKEAYPGLDQSNHYDWRTLAIGLLFFEGARCRDKPTVRRQYQPRHTAEVLQATSYQIQDSRPLCYEQTEPGKWNPSAAANVCPGTKISIAVEEVHFLLRRDVHKHVVEHKEENLDEQYRVLALSDEAWP